MGESSALPASTPTCRADAAAARGRGGLGRAGPGAGWTALEPAGGARQRPRRRRRAVRVRPARRRRGGAGRPVLVGFHGWTDSGECSSRWPRRSAGAGRWSPRTHRGTAVRGGGAGAGTWSPTRCRAGSRCTPRSPVAGRRAPVVVLGHSMGALTAAGVAAARPRRAAPRARGPGGHDAPAVGRLAAADDAVRLQADDECERERPPTARSGRRTRTARGCVQGRGRPGRAAGAGGVGRAARGAARRRPLPGDARARLSGPRRDRVGRGGGPGGRRVPGRLRGRRPRRRALGASRGAHPLGPPSPPSWPGTSPTDP